MYTTIHSLFAGTRGCAVLSTGPVAVALLKLSPTVAIEDYGVGRYKVRYELKGTSKPLTLLNLASHNILGSRTDGERIGHCWPAGLQLTKAR